MFLYPVFLELGNLYLILQPENLMCFITDGISLALIEEALRKIKRKKESCHI